MTQDISKLSADFLREHILHAYGEKLGASHAREIVAAIFGYRTHAALLAEQEFPLSEIETADVLAPPIVLIDERMKAIDGLPPSLPGPEELVRVLHEYLQIQGFFGGQLWLSNDIGKHVVDEYLPEHEYEIHNELAGAMAETNAIFDEPAHYDDWQVEVQDDAVVVRADGELSGSNDPDRPFSGDKILFRAELSLYRVAGRAGFNLSDLEVGGAVDDSWYSGD